MKKFVVLAMAAFILVGMGFSNDASAFKRKGNFRLGFYAPGLFIGNKYVDTMMSIGLEGEYYFLENLSVALRLEEATDFKIGSAPHSIFMFDVRARYVFDVGQSGKWALYAQAGAGGALIGKSNGAVDIAIPGGGFWYEWWPNWFAGIDTSLHILVRNPTAIAFDIVPTIRYQF